MHAMMSSFILQPFLPILSYLIFSKNATPLKKEEGFGQNAKPLLRPHLQSWFFMHITGSIITTASSPQG
jgi:hypothetical protein